ncbi:hypothetical protein HG530_015709 [Fusarium avenaceum]|nr:hypothetical protein HG530_015709 [Fusarium avenaceum]
MLLPRVHPSRRDYAFIPIVPMLRGLIAISRSTMQMPCEAATNGWTNSTYRASQPLGYDYPLNDSCPLTALSANTPSSECSIGSWPMYAVNVTDEEDIVKSIKFARQSNLRLVIKSTGHDFLQRSTGYGSLSIWLHHLRQGYTLNDHHPGLKDCLESGWNGSTITIKGSYAWSDLYPAAKEKGVILVGGNSVGPCSTGGWVQGGGHSPVTRYYGIGADQVLSARVVLASGKVVTASPCQHKELFYAIRGGGGGTYGVVTEMTVKTYPTEKVVVASIVIGSEGDDGVSDFLDAVTTVYSSYPDLSTLGFAGYGYWSTYTRPGLVFGNYTNVLQQSFLILQRSEDQARTLFHPFEKKILRFNDTQKSTNVTITWKSYPDYGSYFDAKTDSDGRVGGVSAMSSRLLDNKALSANTTRLRQDMNIMAGSPGNPVFHTIVHHGLEVSEIGSEHRIMSAVQPGWYNSVILNIFEKSMNGTQVDDNIKAFTELRDIISPVYRLASPTTGTYMNEADWGDSNWRQDFYGAHWQNLGEIKARYDPSGGFYCQTCVGSDLWREDKNKALCKVGSYQS